jgi:hypothetical protein
MKMDGDPKFVMYYEMFQPGEAVGWELYNDDLWYRAVVMLPTGFSGDLPSVIAGVRNMIFNDNDFKDEQYKPTKVNVVIGNLLLTDTVDPTTGEPTGTDTPGLGKWEGDNFKLGTNTLSTSLLKTTPKYLACGDNTICLKTPQYIYTYPLSYCADVMGDGTRDYIQLVRQFTATRNWEKEADFYLASPCKTKINVKLDDCKDNLGANSPGGCEAAIQYPIYNYDEGFAKIGTHISCLDKIGSCDDKSCDTSGDKNLIKDNPDLNARGLIRSDSGSSTSPTKCIRVILDLNSEFCYTKNSEHSVVGGVYPVENHNVFKLYTLDDGRTYPVIVSKPVSYKWVDISGFFINRWRWPGGSSVVGW